MSEQEVKDELREIRRILKGSPYDREDRGLVGDVHDLSAFMQSLLRWSRALGVILLTTSAGAIAARFFT